jgi:3-deoxy-D-manno-octulosonic-acid transferase
VNNAVACGAAVQVENVKELVNNVNEIMRDKNRQQKMAQAGMAFCEQHRGATARTMQIVAEVLK